MKDQKGMFENIDAKLYDFIYANSESICPEGKYDKTMSCSHSNLIRFINPIMNQNKELIEDHKHLKNYAGHTEFCSWKMNGNGICDCGYIKKNQE